MDDAYHETVEALGNRATYLAAHKTLAGGIGARLALAKGDRG